MAKKSKSTKTKKKVPEPTYSRAPASDALVASILKFREHLPPPLHEMHTVSRQSGSDLLANSISREYRQQVAAHVAQDPDHVCTVCGHDPDVERPVVSFDVDEYLTRSHLIQDKRTYTPNHVGSMPSGFLERPDYFDKRAKATLLERFLRTQMKSADKLAKSLHVQPVWYYATRPGALKRRIQVIQAAERIVRDSDIFL